MSVFTANDFANAFADPDAFGEPPGSVIYKPKGGGTRVINAVIERYSPQAVPGAGRSAVPKAIIMVANSNTLGISSAEFNSGGDHLNFSLQIGKPADDYVLYVTSDEKQNQDPGMLRLEVRG